MQALQCLPLRYKFWAVNGVAFLSTLVLVLVAMLLEQRSVNQTRQDQALNMLQLWHESDTAAVEGPLQPRLLQQRESEQVLRTLFEAAGPDSRWVPLSSPALLGGDRPIGAWVTRGAGAAVRAVLVDGKTFQQIFTERAPVYAMAVFLLMSIVLIGSQMLIRFVDHYQRQLQRMAHYDVLTGLPNRVLARDRLDHARGRVIRHGGYLAVLFIDLDRFKTINDSHGHGIGDAVLRAVADRLRARCREEDTLSRLGGDEFLLILEQLPSADLADQIAAHLLALLERPLMLEDSREVYVGASIGIAIYPGDGEATTELIRNADAAMYRAKSKGRNTFSHYVPALTEKARERFELERALREAMAMEELSLHYQPLMELDTGRCLGAEALLRWNSHRHGQVAPGTFVPLAEDSGLIVPIGSWVLHQACRQGKLWLDAGMNVQTLAVNISPIQFMHQDIVRLVAGALQSTGLPPSRLELEITEGALMSHIDQAGHTLHALKQLGVRIAVDDFGTGYSSLAYLRRFPLDKLKIDKSFLVGVPEDTGECQLVRTVVDLGRNLGLEVLAEGIETAAQRCFLQSEGCHHGQGYLFARPMPAEHFVCWYQAQLPVS
ncbi:diguanylate cyclase (GGDEF) domain-containing protein [Halopseudomonas xinjiangensis]|uniref:cyclic-guanylate-specific phosphodiesterase n=1 Tax=Halopseudomonas xinjiangensis TaxID=487184 RepID=A0A1H1XDJ5_9GAMM|nr:EAL domain-containing protein [Halopseudomonas xinjiangensis]SDT07161.1 diguanylate cyclase (GGDEF) domain-containing protein [Halopseudomonas xinjiangensis]